MTDEAATDGMRDWLEEIYGQLKEGFNSPIPTRARALLQDLA